MPHTTLPWAPASSCPTLQRGCWACARLLPVLQVLDAAQTLESPIHHDGQAGAQRLAFLHAEGTGQASIEWQRGTVPGAVAGRQLSAQGHQLSATAPSLGMGKDNRGLLCSLCPCCMPYPGTEVSPPTNVPGGMGCRQDPHRPVRGEHHGATSFDDIQDEVPEEAPRFGVHAGGWLILRAAQHPQTRQTPQGPYHPLPALGLAQDTAPHPWVLVKPGAGSSHSGSFLHPGAAEPQGGGGWRLAAGLAVPHQEDEGWVSDQRDRRRQLPLVAAAVAAGRLGSILGQLQLLQGPLHYLQGVWGLLSPCQG